MGGALAVALDRMGYEIRAVVSRSLKSARNVAGLMGNVPSFNISKLNSMPASDLILITAIDPAIGVVAEKFAKTRFAKLNNPVVLHTSGPLSSEVLKPLRDIGCAVGSMHPLASISAPVEGAKRFAGAYFCIEGDVRAVELAEQIVRDLRGKSFSIETKFKPRYHAAAVMTSGHTTALFSVAVEALSKCGLSEETAALILLPLLRGTVENLAAKTPAEALTGTFARADAATFEKHVKALAKNAGEDALDVYLLLGKISLNLAEQHGADKEQIKSIRRKMQRLGK
jgi:predicted short-subunit dehydrogenase-like oxidoreductase (DUF2520 family)